jgi:hypothetical protein
MDSPLDPLETFWDQILSRDPRQVREAYATLSAEERQALRNHLARMVSEPGWQPEQRESAQAALDALAPGE